MVSQAQIQEWLRANPGATDTQIAQAMKQSGVGSAQSAQATGVDHSEVQRRLSTVRNGKEFTDRAYGQAPATPAAPTRRPRIGLRQRRPTPGQPQHPGAAPGRAELERLIKIHSQATRTGSRILR